MLGYLFRARKYFSPSKPSHLVQRPNKALSEVLLSCLGCCCSTTMSIFDAIQNRAIRLAGDSSFTCRTQLLCHRQAVGDRSLFYRYINRSLFYRYINGVCSNKLFTMVTPLTRPLRCTRGSCAPLCLECLQFGTVYQETFFSSLFKTNINKLPLNSL
nr:unnamed protein product [Callosobruchus chinensis]